ncbi:GntR family transcriptional regulator [Sesbania bispinosa]|nr:GntR family transcriptional regulator [Sesbania bispinosa]
MQLYNGSNNGPSPTPKLLFRNCASTTLKCDFAGRRQLVWRRRWKKKTGIKMAHEGGNEKLGLNSVSKKLLKEGLTCSGSRRGRPRSRLPEKMECDADGGLLEVDAGGDGGRRGGDGQMQGVSSLEDGAGCWTSREPGTQRSLVQLGT